MRIQGRIIIIAVVYKKMDEKFRGKGGNLKSNKSFIIDFISFMIAFIILFYSKKWIYFIIFLFIFVIYIYYNRNIIAVVYKKNE